MPLNTAHEGYEYQDLLTASFILKEILNEEESEFKIDFKEFENDKFDDLTIINRNGTFKKQVKYSNEASNHTASKDDFANANNYDLAFFDLFRSWNNNRTSDLRACLAWNSPTDKLKDFLKISSAPKTFPNVSTNVFQIDIDKLWKENEDPDSSWRKFVEESKSINRAEFSLFCDAFVIETEFPRQSLSTDFDGAIENILLQQIQKLGIGEYPNHHITPKVFALELIRLITTSRSRGLTLKTNDLLNKLGVRTNFGAIEQVFPIDEKRNIKTENNIKSFIDFLEENTKVILKGEPGSGKSWFVQNLEKELQNADYQIIKHYCYTDLKDDFSKDRILLNTFYGNLVKAIISIFPELKNEKQQVYASNLQELNLLLSKIDKKTVLIIDGLDHIERVFKLNENSLTTNEIAIIQAINQLEFSENVKLLVASQPIEDLNELKDYATIDVPKWSKGEVLAYFIKNEIKDAELSENVNLTDALLAKCEGNPLYLNFLIEEIKGFDSISLEKLNELPIYNYNLKNYYDYLITKLNFDASVPQILSGVNFSLSRKEIKEITGQGNKVEKAIAILKPILNEKLTTGGFMIYHESFRRFVLEKLQAEEVEIGKAIYEPVIQWLGKEGFWEFTKSYRYYFQLLHLTEKHDTILDFLKPNFILESVYFGYSFEAIKKNYQYMALSAIHQKDLPNIITANELHKVIGTTANEYGENFSTYFTALGHLRGFKTAADFLVFDEKPTLDKYLGIQACHICNLNSEPAPLDLYFDYFDNKGLSIDEFEFYLRGFLYFKDVEGLIKIANQITKYTDYVYVFQKELLLAQNLEFVKTLRQENKIIEELLNYQEVIAYQEKDVLDIVNKLLNIKGVLEEDGGTIRTLFIQILKNINNKQLIDKVIGKFSNEKWFYRWLIFAIKMTLFQEDRALFSFNELKTLLLSLIEKDKEYSSLSYIKKLIDNSFGSIFKFSFSEYELSEIIDLLVEISQNTSWSYQGGLGGPLSMDSLFRLLDENANEHNRIKIIAVFEDLIEEKQDYYLHSYLTDFYFRLSRQYSLNEEKEKAKLAFKKGVEFYLGYTHRKDTTLEDVMYAVKSYAIINPKKGNEDIKKIKDLVDAVCDHTDGKGTKWFPITWYKEYLDINFQDASLWLLSNIKKSYYWINEHQLEDWLLFEKRTQNPIVELFVFLTFPIKTTEDFLNYGLDLVQKTENIDNQLSKMLLDNLLERFENEKSNDKRKYSISFLKKLKRFSDAVQFDKNKIDTKYQREHIAAWEFFKNLDEKCIVREEFSDMNMEQLTEYCSNHKLTNTDVHSLCYYFDTLSELTEEVKSLITAIVEKHEKYPKNKALDLSIIFEKNDDFRAFFFTNQFVYEKDGWFHNLQNIDAFEKAYTLKPDLAFESLIKELNLYLKYRENGYNSRVSSNLINALVKVGYNKEIVEKMWQNLYETTNLRLPFQEKLDWKEALENPNDLNEEEILICLLFTRFNANTTERHHWTLAGLSYLYENYPTKMIKPTRWFLQNTAHFLTVNIMLIFEILLDIDLKDKAYKHNFTKELEALFPSEYYLIDFILGYLLSKEEFVVEDKLEQEYPCTQQLFDFFRYVNYRNEILAEYFDFDHIAGKYKHCFEDKYSAKYEFLGNRSIERIVPNIFPANYILELINAEFKADLFQAPIYDLLKIDYKTIVAQTNSYATRPHDIVKPSSIHTRWNKQEIVDNEWIRLGYFEHEMYGEYHEKNNDAYVFAGIVFADDLEETIPISRLRLYPQHLWGNRQMYDLDVFLPVTLIQEHDSLEDYKILWLNAILLDFLELEIANYTNGLCAKNSNGETVLKYNRWSSNYIDNDDMFGIMQEIPRLEGAELFCRKDYFERICSFYENKKAFFYVSKK